MELKTLNEEVLISAEPLASFTADDVAELKKLARANGRRRIRICAHSDTTDSLHEMLIVHMRGAYVRPHKHIGKTESVHVIEGEAEAVFFDENGVAREVISLGQYGSARHFYYRLEEPAYHTLLIGSEFFVMHEVTSGPFRREETVFAPWAPAEDDESAVAAFRLQISGAVEALRR